MEKMNNGFLARLGKMNKWFYAFLGVATVLTVAIIAVVILGVNLDRATTPPDTTEGAETGVYYYDVAGGEVVLSLNSGYKFTLTGPNLNKSGDYSVSGDTVTLDFVKDEDGTATATILGDTVTLTYNESVMNLLKKIDYTVSFDVAGGSTVGSATVVNGKTVAKPDDPAKDGYVFLGWYANGEFTKAFDFVGTAIRANTTVYAKWAAKAIGQDEYAISFDLGYDGSAPDGISTVGGKLVYSASYQAPVRDGYTFEGWFVSAYEDGEKLTYEATEGMTVGADTTLYAVWSNADSQKLASPKVSIVDNSIKWESVSGATGYEITIKDADGNVIKTESIGQTVYTYAFSDAEPGDYTVSVVAVSGGTVSNSDATVRYYRNKALGRVAKFEAVGSMLVFSSVANADKYIVTVDCGTAGHNHTLFDNGKSTVYDFSNCEMKAGGIVFTVIAKAEGYADSVPATYIIERNLDKINAIAFDEVNQTYSWESIPNATKYYVTVTCGNHTHATVDNGTATSYSVKTCSGDISISVYPASAGYNSPAATTATYTKTVPATPENLNISNMTVTWDAIEGATGYIVKVNDKSFPVTDSKINLGDTGITFTAGMKIKVSVQAIKDGVSSAESDSISSTYLTMGRVIYGGNAVSWDPVVGVNKYEIKLNNEASVIVDGETSLGITFTKEGLNVIKVRTADYSNTEWTEISVIAYKVTYDTRSLEGVHYEYVAVGDTLELPSDFTNAGYDFDSWYCNPGAAEGNGKKYDSTVFQGSGAITLYANWAPKTYKIELVGIEDYMSGAAAGDKLDVIYTKGYTLPVLTTTDTIKSSFAGWYTHPDGKGTKLTDYLGNSVSNYAYIGDYIAYPYFTSGMIFELDEENNTYSVRKGPDIDIIPVITIPAVYNNIPVTTILENGFYNCDKLVEIHIPDTIKLIGAGAFNSCDALVSIDVYDVDPTATHEVIYSSADGALLYYDGPSGLTYLELYPRAKKGAYTVPEEVDIIRNKAIIYTQVTSVTVSKNVKMIGSYGIAYNSYLKEIIFEEGSTNPVSIHYAAFYRNTVMTYIKLPAYVKDYADDTPFDVMTLEYIPSLETIEVEKKADAYYTSVEGMLCNASGDTLLYCPLSYKNTSGILEVPVGITAIGDNVFKARNNFTSISINPYITEIGQNAFAECKNVTSIKFAGSRTKNLVIKEGAFINCGKVKSITFEGSTDGSLDTGAVTIGANAFTGMLNLRELNVGAGANIAEIGSGAFFGNAKLRTINVSDDAAIAIIGARAFAGCEGIVSFTIHKTTVSVGDRAFEGCSFLSSIAFAPNGLDIDFGSYVFKDCYGLSTVELPATVKSFDGSAFDGCYSIKEIKVDPANAYLETINGVLYDEAVTEIMFYPKAIDDPDLSELPWNTLTKIGNTVFKDNPNVTSVTIPAGITAIGDEAFNSCINLKTVSFASANSAVTIGRYAFANCQKLDSITLPATTVSIGDYAFYVSAIESFTVPANVATIGNFAFAYSNIKSITIPAKVSMIGDGAFAYSSLDTITIEEGDGSVPLTIGSISNFNINYNFESLDYNVYNNAPKFPDAYIGVNATGVFRGTSLTDVAIPKRVVSIGAFAFYDVNTLGTVTIADDSNLSNIGTGAFYESTLSSIDLGKTNITVIRDYAFSKTALTSITIPNTITEIAKYAFAESTKLASVTFATGGTTPLTIGNLAFQSTCFTTITLPKTLSSVSGHIQTMSSSSTYAINVKRFYKIFQQNFKLEEIIVEDGCAQYGSLDGIFYEKDENGNLAELIYCPPAKTGDVTIPNTVTKVEFVAFNFTKLSKITFEELPEDHANYGKPILIVGDGTTTNSPASSVSDAKFGNSAVVFGNTGTLTEVRFPSHLKSIGSNAFYNNTASELKIIFNMAATDVVIEPHAFYSNSALKSIDLPKISNLDHPSYTSEYTFGYCRKLTSVTFAEGSTFDTIPQYFFYYCESLVTVEIPSNVKVIDVQSFYNCTKLESITYAENSKLEKIGDRAFYNCKALAEFVIPDTVTKVGYGLFDGCIALKKVTVSKGIKSIEVTDQYNNLYSIFYNCSSISEFIVPSDHPTLKVVDGVIYDVTGTILFAYPVGRADAEGFTVPNGVREIAAYAFANYKQTSITFPETLASIGKGAFYTSSLKSVDIPATVTVIGETAFYNNKSLQTLTFEDGSLLTELGGSVFSGTIITSVSLPDNIKTFGNGVFNNCDKLKSVILPAALEAVTTSTFYSCDKLESVIIQENVSKIGSSSFGYSVSLKEITFPAKLQTIDGQAFYQCTSLKYVHIPENCQLSQLGVDIFRYCKSLKEITLPATLDTLPQGVFIDCASLEFVDLSKTQIVEFTSKTNSSINGVPVLKGAFEGCTSLREILLPETLEIMGNKTFLNCKKLESISLPKSLITIGDQAFDGCESLAVVQFSKDATIEALGSDPTAESAIFRNTKALTSISLPDSITSIGGHIFENSGIRDISLPANLSVISKAAFKGCEGITSLSIPSTVADIYDEAFMNCENLSDVQINEGVEFIGADAFGNCSKITEIYIPESVLRMGGNPFSNCTGVTSFEVAPTNENFIYGADGVLYDANVRTVIYYPPYLENESYTMPATVYELAKSAFASSKLKNIVISDNIKIIPEGCFRGSTLLESVTIPLSVTSIGDYSFQNCESLKSVVVPNSCTYLGEHAFENNKSLTSFDFGKRNTTMYVGAYLLSGCESLSDITFPEGASRLPEYMFAGTAIENLVVPATVTNLSSEGVFKDCKKLKTVTFEETEYDSWSGIGEYMFQNCESLTEIIIPEGIYCIGGDWGYGRSFENCKSLKKVVFPSTLGIISEYAFANCTSLETVEFAEDTELWAICAWAFYNCSALESIELPDNCSELDYGAFVGTSLKGRMDLNCPYIYLYGQVFQNCTGITELHIAASDDILVDNWGKIGEDEWDASADFANFLGWTEDQSIYFDGYTYEDIQWLFECDEITNSFIGCEAKIYDCDGNQIFYDSETGYMIEVRDSENNVIYSAEE